ncbi:DoxX family membrane protein [Bradyrhizobium liaoningense]|uniref:DoxX family protein n=1 Tax=Bradyrhizobium liaoningense TaxID=43992 RepID=UPI001BA812B6|nr:DoxX family membrane protein [Bradyrhizobium liaoningense]MBR0735534.1 DoxX family membrane protein [Bradyrhizobium liaoningense]
MPAFVTFGRILFAVLFIYTGATKLFAMQATADFIATKLVVPEAIAPYAKQIETATAMTTPQLLAIAVGALEVISGLMIALNFGARFFAMLLIIYVAVATVLFYDFWNMAAPDNAKTLVDALKNLSIIGALFMIMGYGRATRSAETAYGDV